MELGDLEFRQSLGVFRMNNNANQQSSSSSSCEIQSLVVKQGAATVTTTVPPSQQPDASPSSLSSPKNTNSNQQSTSPSSAASPAVPPSPQPDKDSIKQVSYRTEDYFRTSRAGRTTSSSFAIAWSFVFLIFLGFFNKYMAYYQYESGQWVRFPILTSDFNAWLPIITATLVFSIVGHIVLIVFDKYLVRETTLMILNLFGIAAVISLLSIFPFNFESIPNNTVANILPILATIILIGIAIGLGIATLASFIRLIVNAATGTARY